MANSYRDSHRVPGTAESYDQVLGDGYLAALWEAAERPMLVHALETARARGATSSLDFACGTGRITAVNETIMERSIGVDISEEMVNRARARCVRSELHVADLTVDEVPTIPSVDVVTAFRFLLNAEDSLRDDALEQMRRRLRPGGTLIVNFQWSASSPVGWGYQLRNRLLSRDDPRTITVAGAAALISRHGFVIESVSRYGLWPRLGGWLSAKQARAVAPAESVLTRHRALERLAQNFLVVARLDVDGNG